MAKKLMDKIKEGVSVEEVESFARKHTTEVFSVLAILIGAISSMYDFFTGPKMTILFVAVGLVLAVLFPTSVERSMKRFYAFAGKQEKLTQFIIGGVQILVSLFLPFVLFGIVGLLAGTSYHYYTRGAQIANENRPQKVKHSHSGDEHD